MQTGDFFGVRELEDLQEGLDPDLLVHDEAPEKKLLGKRPAPEASQKKSKKEVFKEIIRQSKLEKYRRVEEREEQRRLVEEMKEEYRGIVGKLSFLDKAQMKERMAEAKGDSDDDDFNGYLMRVKHEGLLRPEREKREKKEEVEEEEDQQEQEEQEEQEEDDEESYMEEESEEDTVGNYQKVEKVKYDEKVDQMEDFEVKERNKQDKKFAELGSKREEKFLTLLNDLENEESSDSEDDLQEVDLAQDSKEEE